MVQLQTLRSLMSCSRGDGSNLLRCTICYNSFSKFIIFIMSMNFFFNYFLDFLSG